MFGKRKRRALVFSAISSIILFTSCQPKFENIEGTAQGTTYHIIYEPNGRQLIKEDLDKVLLDFDMSLSTYQKNSLISNINALSGAIPIPKKDQYFTRCFLISKEVAELTNGDFDPTLFPLMQLWGFMKGDYNVPDDSSIDSVMQFVGWDKELFLLDTEKSVLQKKNIEAKLDFNAVAQGLSVDVLAEYLNDFGIENYFVELGGELRVSGTNRVKEPWKIGVDLPVESNNGLDERQIGSILEITSGAIATSGNYRKFFEKDGQKFVHTMNPHIGRPATNKVLSATVFCPDAARADAYATALMAMGLERAKDMTSTLEKKGIHFVLSYSGDGKRSNNIGHQK